MNKEKIREARELLNKANISMLIPGAIIIKAEVYNQIKSLLSEEELEKEKPNELWFTDDTESTDRLIREQKQINKEHAREIQKLEEKCNKKIKDTLRSAKND
jgi:hypothetical protein